MYSAAFGNLLFGKTCVVGRKRKVNQDAVDIFIPEAENPMPPLMVLADGMGGHNGGEVASRIVLETFQENYLQQKSASNLPHFLVECVEHAHTHIKERAAADPALAGMGSTVAAAFIADKKLHVINVGDSRVYLLRGERIIQVSEDQSFVADQVRVGLITPEEARHHPKRNVLSMAINASRPVVMPVLNEVDFESNDVLLLCSDGLWGVVNEAFLWAAANEFEPQAAADKLAAFANSGGGPDNISVLIARRKDRRVIKTLNDDATRD